MPKTSEEAINSTLSSPVFVFSDCFFKEKAFSFIFFYFIRLVFAIFGTAAHLWYLQFYLCGTECKFTPTHVFFLNHSVMELIYCLECVPEILDVFVFNNYLIYKFNFFLFGLSWFGRPLLQTWICIEQYLAVHHPLTFLQYKDIKYRIAVSVATWFIAFGYGIHTFELQNFPDPFFNFVFFTEVTVILFCCVSVLCDLKKSHKRINNQTGRYIGNQQTRNVFNTIFYTLLIILLTYFPQVLYSLLFITDIDKKLFYCNILPFICFLNTWSAIITPLLKMYREGHLKLNSVFCKSVK